MQCTDILNAKADRTYSKHYNLKGPDNEASFEKVQSTSTVQIAILHKNRVSHLEGGSDVVYRLAAVNTNVASFSEFITIYTSATKLFRI